MNLRPLGDRVLIRPEVPATTTASGLVLAEHRKPEQTGIVVAVGPCAHRLKWEAERLADGLDACVKSEIGAACPQGDHQIMAHSAIVLRDLVRPTPLVKEGDYVVFSWVSGQEILIEDGVRYLLMRESDILAVVEGLEV